MNTKARFISFEGTEGVGKTTAINNVCAILEQRGIDFIRTREPGGSDFAEAMREILLNPETTINDDTELLLMFTARCDHIANVIKPALDAGMWVVCDRFTDSTIAYQGFGRCTGLDISDIDVLPPAVSKIQLLIDNFVAIQPDMTVWLDLPIQEGMERAIKRSQADRFEQEKLDFFQRIYQGYEYIAKTQPRRFQRVDARGSADEVATRIIDTLGIS